MNDAMPRSGTTVKSGEDLVDPLATLSGDLFRLYENMLQPDTHSGESGEHIAGEDIGERTRAEAESRNLAARLTTTLDSITDAFFTLDPEWRFTFINAQAERLLQRPRAELIGQDFRTAESSGAVWATFESECRRAAANKESVRFEEYYRPGKAWFAVRVYPSGDGVAVYFLDITERKRESRRLRESRQRLALATESAKIGVWDWDVVANKLVWDAQMYALYGVPRAEFSGAYEAWQNGLHPDDRERAEAEMAAAINGTNEFHTEFRVVWRNGDVHHLEAHAMVQRAANGSPERAIGVNWDITARKQSEKLAEQAWQRLNEAQRIGQIGDWEWDFATQAITWSPQLFEIMGRDAGLGQPRDFEVVGGMFDSASRALMEEKVAQVIQSGETQEYDLLARRPDGVTIEVHARAAPVKDSRGEVMSLRGTLQDVSARKRGEQAIQDRVRQQELIATLGRRALGDTELDLMFAEAASAVAKGLSTGYSSVLQFMDLDRCFTRKAGVGWEPGWPEQPICLVEVDNPRVRNPAPGRVAIVADFMTEPNHANSEFLGRNGIASGIELSIECEHGEWGVLGAYSCEPDRFSAENLDFLKSIVNILAAAIDRKGRELVLVRLAQYDPLTGLPNRSLVNDRLRVALAQARESGTRLAVLYLDLDQFKKVNDAFGHSMGDRLLQEVSSRLSGSVRAGDTVSRQGGDEFLILLREIASEEEAARIAERLIQSMDEPISIDGVELRIRGSIGITCFPDNGPDAETLIRNADAAMYAAKGMVLSSYRFYSEDMNARAHSRLVLEADLSQAIARDELFLEFQCQVAMASGAVTGVEALVRWRHATLGVIAPACFIPVAEEDGLIVSIGAWVLEAACRQQAQWVRAGIARGRMAVNISAVELRRPDFFDTVVQTLERTGLDPGQLEMELTESVVMQGVDGILEKLIALDKLGVSLAIDDFGTGQSNLGNLKQFPIRRLKIDRSFIGGLPNDAKSGALAQAIIGMGHALGMKVIAEGIETREQAEYLQSMWCDHAQGFFYSLPVVPADCEDLLRTGLCGADC